MLSPLEAAEISAVRALRERTDGIAAALEVEGDLARGEDIVLLAAPRRRGTDSLHVVVMDAHRELNALQARIATESIDGARAHDLREADRPLVRHSCGGFTAPSGCASTIRDSGPSRPTRRGARDPE